MKLLDTLQHGFAAALATRLVLGISLAPETYTEGSGGFLDDADVQFLALKFRTSEGTPYDKAGSKVVPLLQVDMLPDGTDEVRTQYYSCGDLAQWAPSANGETLEPQSDKAKESGGINKTSNAAMFLLSLVQSGMPGSKLASERISDLAGIKAHVVVTKRPKDNIKRAEGAKEPTVLTVNRIISMPDGTAPVAQAASNVPLAVAAKQHDVAKQVATGNGGVFDDASLAMLAMTVLQAAPGGSLKKIQLMQEVHKASAGGAIPADAKDPDGKPARSTAPQRVYADAFLQAQPFWRFDGTTVTLQ